MDEDTLQGLRREREQLLSDLAAADAGAAPAPADREALQSRLEMLNKLLANYSGGEATP